MAKKKVTGTRKRAQPNPAVKAAQEILDLANPNDGNELTDAQQKDLFSKCERTISTYVEGYLAVAVAVRTIQRLGLYKIAGYDNFEAYCRARWDFSRQLRVPIDRCRRRCRECQQL